VNVFASKGVNHQAVDLPESSILEATFVPLYSSLPCCPRCHSHYVLLQNHLGNLFLHPCLAHEATNTRPEALKIIQNNNKALVDFCSLLAWWQLFLWL